MPTVDVVSSGTTGAVNAATLGWPHVTLGTTNRALVVGMMIRNANSQVVNTVVGSAPTYGTQLLTFGTAISMATNTRVEYWYLINPTVGTFNVNFRLSPASSTALVGISVGLSGVNQSTPVGTFTQGSSLGATSISLNPLTVSGDLVVAMLSNRGLETFTVGSGETLQATVATSLASGGANTRGVASSEVAAGGVFTNIQFITSPTATTEMAAAAVAWKVAAAGTPQTVSPASVGTNSAVSAVTQLAFRVFPASAPSNAAFGVPAQFNMTFTPPSVGSNAAFGLSRPAVNPSSVGTNSAFGVPTFQFGTSISPPSVPSNAVVGVPTFTWRIFPASVGTNSAFGVPSFAFHPPSVGSNSAFGVPTFTFRILPPSVGTNALVGAPDQFNMTFAPASVASNSFIGTRTIVLAGAGLVTRTVEVPGGTLSTGNMIRGSVWIRITTGTAGYSAEILYGGQVLLTFPNSTQTIQCVEFIVMAAGTTSSQRAYGKRYGEPFQGVSVATGTGTVDSTTLFDLQLRLTKQPGAGLIVSDHWEVEVIRA